MSPPTIVKTSESFVRSFRVSKHFNLEVHLLEDIFRIGTVGGTNRFLINSANEYLCGTVFSYFPRGGFMNQPKNVLERPKDWMKSSLWCGMEAGSDMIYPQSSMDGQTHQFLRGELVDNDYYKSHHLVGEKITELQRYIEKNVPYVGKETVQYHVDGENVECASSESDIKSQYVKPTYQRRIRDPDLNSKIRCVTGSVVWTPNFSTDPEMFSRFSGGILHVVAPYYDEEERDRLLRQCYMECLKCGVGRSIEKESSTIRFTTALLGTGVKNISREVSSKALIDACVLLKGASSGNGSKAETIVELVIQEKNAWEEVTNEFARNDVLKQV